MEKRTQQNIKRSDKIMNFLMCNTVTNLKKPWNKYAAIFTLTQDYEMENQPVDIGIISTNIDEMVDFPQNSNTMIESRYQNDRRDQRCLEGPFSDNYDNYSDDIRENTKNTVELSKSNCKVPYNSEVSIYYLNRESNSSLSDEVTSIPSVLPLQYPSCKDRDNHVDIFNTINNISINQDKKKFDLKQLKIYLIDYIMNYLIKEASQQNTEMVGVSPKNETMSNSNCLKLIVEKILEELINNKDERVESAMAIRLSQSTIKSRSLISVPFTSGAKGDFSKNLSNIKICAETIKSVNDSNTFEKLECNTKYAKTVSILTLKNYFMCYENSNCLKSEDVSKNLLLVKTQENNNELSEDQCKKEQWSENQKKFQKFPFLGRQQLKVNPPGEGKPIDFFFLLADNELIEILVEETNNNAIVEFSKKLSNDKIQLWKPINKKDLLSFLGFTFYMKTVQLPNIDDYWRDDRLFNLPIRFYMTKSKYLYILQYLTFPRKPSLEKGNPDKLDQVRFLIDYFNNQMLKIYSPGKNISINTPILLFHENQLYLFINSKLTSGTQFYLLRESNGIVLNMQIFSGDFKTLKNLKPAIIVSCLMENYLSKGHSLFMSSLYNSLAIAKYLLERKTYSTGIICKRESELPKEVLNAKLKSGETIQRYFGNICLSKWRKFESEKREYLYISTKYKNRLIDFKSISGDIKRRPQSLMKFRKHTKMYDLQRLLLSVNSMDRKNLSLHIEVGFQIFEIMLYNAFVLYNTYSSPKMSLSDFRQSVIEELMSNNEINLKNRQIEKVAKYLHIRSTMHLPLLDKKENQENGQKEVCWWCSRNGICKYTMYCCQVCSDKPYLCLGPCFKEYHDHLPYE